MQTSSGATRPPDAVECHPLHRFVADRQSFRSESTRRGRVSSNQPSRGAEQWTSQRNLVVPAGPADPRPAPAGPATVARILDGPARAYGRPRSGWLANARSSTIDTDTPRQSTHQTITSPSPNTGQAAAPGVHTAHATPQVPHTAHATTWTWERPVPVQGASHGLAAVRGWWRGGVVPVSRSRRNCSRPPPTVPRESATTARSSRGQSSRSESSGPAAG